MARVLQPEEELEVEYTAVRQSGMKPHKKLLSLSATQRHSLFVLLAVFLMGAIAAVFLIRHSLMQPKGVPEVESLNVNSGEYEDTKSSRWDNISSTTTSTTTRIPLDTKTTTSLSNEPSTTTTLKAITEPSIQVTVSPPDEASRWIYFLKQGLEEGPTLPVPKIPQGKRKFALSNMLVVVDRGKSICYVINYVPINGQEPDRNNIKNVNWSLLEGNFGTLTFNMTADSDVLSQSEFAYLVYSCSGYTVIPVKQKILLGPKMYILEFR